MGDEDLLARRVGWEAEEAEVRLLRRGGTVYAVQAGVVAVVAARGSAKEGCERVLVVLVLEDRGNWMRGSKGVDACVFPGS